MHYMDQRIEAGDETGADKMNDQITEKWTDKLLDIEKQKLEEHVSRGLPKYFIDQQRIKQGDYFQRLIEFGLHDLEKEKRKRVDIEAKRTALKQKTEDPNLGQIRL